MKIVLWHAPTGRWIVELHYHWQPRINRGVSGDRKTPVFDGTKTECLDFADRLKKAPVEVEEQ